MRELLISKYTRMVSMYHLPKEYVSEVPVEEREYYMEAWETINDIILTYDEWKEVIRSTYGVKTTAS